MRLRIGTRGSDLARTQAGAVARMLTAAGHEPELVVIRTSGDDSEAPFAGGTAAQGVFVREIEAALLAEEVDLAVHSYKDLPSVLPPELMVAAVPKREDPADVLIRRHTAADDGAEAVPSLPPGAVVGTASARRSAWTQHEWPQIVVRHLRGNVPTRLRRLRDGDYDAIVLAAAGLSRLGAGVDTTGLLVERLDPSRFVPAPTQGALAIQCRRDAGRVRREIAALEDARTRRTTDAERALMEKLDGGCEQAFGAWCDDGGDTFTLVAMIEVDGRIVRRSLDGLEPESLVEPMFAALTREAP